MTNEATYKSLTAVSVTGYDSDGGIAYAYDGAGRMTNVCFGAMSFRHGYLPHTRHLESVSNSCGIGRQCVYEDDRNLIVSVTNFSGSSTVAAFSYLNDAVGRRVVRNNDTFSYNARSELTNAVINADGYGYGYDGIGNRVWSAVNTLTNTYAANRLNQYTLISNPVNPVNPVQILPTYDADGNMRWDGKMRHFWDAENRLVQSQPYGIATNGSVRVVNRYDHMSRLVESGVEVLTGRGAGYPLDPSQPGSWDAVETRIFIYDGWLPVLEKITRTGGVTETREHVWGLDLSGTRGGAGGVGGLLATRINDAWFFPLYDANGNVTDYINEQGATVAHREYGPFGETLAASGPMADVFNFWFSTKYLHHETGLYYYGERYYSPELGRFLSRDPIGEEGGLNEYGFVDNDPVNRLDYLGKETIAVPKCHAYLILGHMIESKPIQWEFPDDCAFGGVVGCWPKQNNPKNPDNRWPNVPMHNEQMFVGLLKRLFSGVALQNIYFSEDHIGAEEQETDFAKAVENALSSVSFKSIVDSLCRSPCCCDNVVLTIQVTKGKWELEHGIKAHSLKPGMTITVKGKCSSRKK